jgi:tetratricopeptide (TPR) repeat protein
MAAWKKILAMSALGVALSSVAQVNLRPEVAKTLQTAQEAIQSKQPDTALQRIHELRNGTQLTEAERMLLERIAIVAAMNAQKFDLAAASLEYLLQNKDLTTADRLTLSETMVTVSLRNKDYPKVSTWAKHYVQAGGTNPHVYLAMIQALSLQKLHKEVLQEMAARQKLDATTGRQPDEAELRVYAFSQNQLKDDVNYVRTLTQLVKRFPSKDYWSDLLNTMGRLPGFSTRLQLDISRLMEATDTLDSADDYTDMAVFALKVGLPYEALRALEKAPSVANAKLKQQAQQRAAEDDKTMKSLSSNSENVAMLVQLGDVMLSKAQWDKAAEAYQKALIKGGHKREAEVRLHCGIALFKLNQVEAAKAMWASVQGEESLVTLSELWLSLAK